MVVQCWICTTRSYKGGPARIYFRIAVDRIVWLGTERKRTQGLLTVFILRKWLSNVFAGGRKNVRSGSDVLIVDTWLP